MAAFSLQPPAGGPSAERRHPVRLHKEPYLALELLRREVERREFARRRVVMRVSMCSIVWALLEIVGLLPEREEARAVRLAIQDILGSWMGGPAARLRG